MKNTETHSVLFNNFPHGILITDKNLNIKHNNKSIPLIKSDFKNLKDFFSSTNIKLFKKYIELKTASCNIILSQKYLNDSNFLDCNISIFNNDFYLFILKDITSKHKQHIIQKCCYSISEAIYNSNDLDTLLREIHSSVSEITNTDNFYISLVDWNNNKIDFPYYIDKYDNKPKSRNFKKGLTEHIIKNEKPILLDIDTYDKFIISNKITVRGKKAFNWLGIPLKLNNNKTIGMLGIQSYKKENKFTEDDLKLLELVSNQIATAIKRKKDDIFIHKQAHYDALTGLTNKALFYDRLDHAILQAQRHDEVISVLFLDIDDFKNVNDTMGHAAGDQLLKIIANIIKDSVRKSDTVSRWGGDEFCILLPSVKNNDGVYKLCERILNKSFKNIKLNNTTIDINASIGVSFYPMDGFKAEQLIDNADKAMYASKKNGKNQFQVYSSK